MRVCVCVCVCVCEGNEAVCKQMSDNVLRAILKSFIIYATDFNVSPLLKNEICSMHIHIKRSRT